MHPSARPMAARLAARGQGRLTNTRAPSYHPTVTDRRRTRCRSSRPSYPVDRRGDDLPGPAGRAAAQPLRPDPGRPDRGGRRRDPVPALGHPVGGGRARRSGARGGSEGDRRSLRVLDRGRRPDRQPVGRPAVGRWVTGRMRRSAGTTSRPSQIALGTAVGLGCTTCPRGSPSASPPRSARRRWPSCSSSASPPTTPPRASGSRPR